MNFYILAKNDLHSPYTYLRRLQSFHGPNDSIQAVTHQVRKQSDGEGNRQALTISSVLFIVNADFQTDSIL